MNALLSEKGDFVFGFVFLLLLGFFSELDGKPVKCVMCSYVNTLIKILAVLF